jgi:hypothetical protein
MKVNLEYVKDTLIRESKLRKRAQFTGSEALKSSMESHLCRKTPGKHFRKLNYEQKLRDRTIRRRKNCRIGANLLQKDCSGEKAP